MATSTIYKCDLCEKFKSDSLEDFVGITVEMFPGRPLELLLCHQKCWKLFRKFWKEMDREMAIETVIKEQEENN